MSEKPPVPAAESFRQVLSNGPYEKIDRLIEIVGRESSQLCDCMIRDAQLLSPGLLELPPFFRSPETMYSHYSFWKIVSLMPDKPLWFYNFESFGFSDINGSEAFRFPPGLTDAPSLKTLILKNLNLDEIPLEIWSMRKLRILDISGNRISSLDKGIGRLRQLVYFNAADNELEILPHQIGGLRKLQILNLSGNRLQALGFSLDGLIKLKKLNLSGNCLETLPPGLNALFQLERVQLAYNDLSAEEEAVWEEGDFSHIPSYQWHFAFEDNATAIR
ncbi:MULTISPECIES: leucine-rich repeat domain-containing protein [unclassified Oceanispirochaeta]|uniref:leucine-rich repeat domain-containing protein n=1 Tax=unclassified Oceanispirochaeta TaxID=2635722 RepID=UPI000E09A420|nr:MULTISPECIES: leucine-rich repeat domain-containing protein [unclassified Oceanispirochaeta]MBF9018502.1 leucine-rich repeat domain-containing protein [Oceanispirochaeta sp. M2]NPD74909.1 leucine-rich repeat domain-containing protein [Oceanispirochaeta sp. M1]RDG29241.1 leucine-rich repeat domain-containing protein [Oceanispirochaeta sp. M1]